MKHFKSKFTSFYTYLKKKFYYKKYNNLLNKFNLKNFFLQFYNLIVKVIPGKIKKFNLIGIPYQLILGNQTDGDLFEFKEINGETQKLNIEEVASQILKAKSN